MNKNNNEKPMQNQDKQTQDKLEKMRSIIADEQRCKEIAQKLCAYIAKN